MKNKTIARRYAKALSEIGLETETSCSIGRDLRDISAIFSSHTELAGLLLNPMYKPDVRTGLVIGICEGLKTTGAVKKFLVLLVENKSLDILQDICSAYYKIEDEIAGRIRAEVETAVSLDEGLKAEIKDKLIRLTGKEVVVSFCQNQELLGGLVIKIGHMVMDGSVKTQLEKVKTRLKTYA